MLVRSLALLAAFTLSSTGGCLSSAYYQRGDTAFDEFEAPQQAGECSAQDDCLVSGCQRERCTTRALAGDSPCDLGAKPQGECGCVDATCVWHN